MMRSILDSTVDGILAHVGELKGKMKERLSDPAELANLELSRKLVALRSDVEIPYYPLTLAVHPGDGLCLEYNYLRSHFDEARVSALAAGSDG